MIVMEQFEKLEIEAYLPIKRMCATPRVFLLVSPDSSLFGMRDDAATRTITTQDTRPNHRQDRHVPLRAIPWQSWFGSTMRMSTRGESRLVSR